MSAKPAARVWDFHKCAGTLGPVPHVGGVVTKGAEKVLINSEPAARAGDACICMTGQSGQIMTGSAKVFFQGAPAARVLDKTSHAAQGSTIVTGSHNVNIGGNSVSGTIARGMKICKALRATRNPPGKTDQSHGNCGLESVRGLINEARAAQGLPPISEEDFFQQAIKDKLAYDYDPNNPNGYGSSTSNDQDKLVNRNGVPADKVDPTQQHLDDALAQGNVVVAMVHPYWWSDGATRQGTNHVVLVVGAEYDEHGNVVAYLINDTGLGKCLLRVDARTFLSGLMQRNSDFIVPRSPR